MWKYETIETIDLAERKQYGALGGARKVYRIFDEDTSDEYYVTADYAITSDRGPETMIFRSDDDGTIHDWGELWSGYGDAVEDDEGIEEFIDELNDRKPYSVRYEWE